MEKEQTKSSEAEFDKTEEVLQEMLRLMGFEVQVEVREDDERILMDIVGDEQRELIGEKGQILDAMQYLLGRMMGKQRGLKTPIVIDNGGYRVRRAEALEEFARQISEKSVELGKAVSINPLSAHDRRIIHMALKEDARVTTRSEGDGLYRRVLVVPNDD